MSIFDEKEDEEEESPGGKINPFEDVDTRSQVRRIDKRALKRSLWGLGLLLAFHAAQLWSWTGREDRPPGWDQSIQLETALDARKALGRGDWGALLRLPRKPGMPPFPPFHHLLIQYAMDEEDPASAALWINLLYMAILCASLYALALRFTGEWPALGVAILFSCVPEVQWLFREQLLDLPLTAWVAAAYAAWFWSEDFERPAPALLFGLLFGAAMMTKWSAFSYFLPVYASAWRARSEPSRRRWALAAALLAAALTAPWYLAQAPVLLPQLVAASADNAQPLWTLNGLLSYPRQMAAGLEFPLFALGLAGVLAAPAGDRGKQRLALETWLLSSFLFWILVPNRQLRYLLPGLIPLAVFAMSGWPRSVRLALCAYQLAAAANFSRAWIAPKELHVVLPVKVFGTRLPAREDWRIEEILRHAAETREPGMPLANLALLANHERFNGANFNWILDRLGLEGLHMRGINRRVCEFAEYLLMKTGSLGDPAVVVQLPEVRERILAEDSWFQRGYEKDRSWPLPDGTEAVLYRRRRRTDAPLPEGRTLFHYYEEGKFAASGLVIELDGWEPGRGVYRKARLKADSLALRGLKIDAPNVLMEDLFLVPVQPPDAKGRPAPDALLDVRLLKMRRLVFASASVSEDSLAQFLRERVPALGEVQVRLDKDVAARVSLFGLPVEARASAELAPGASALVLRAEELKVAGVPLPTALLGPLRRYVLDFSPNPELPFEIEVSRLSISGGWLRVGS